MAKMNNDKLERVARGKYLTANWRYWDISRHWVELDDNEKEPWLKAAIEELEGEGE